MIKLSRLFAIVILILLIFGLLLSGLEQDSLWMDEAYSAWLVRDDMRMPESPRDILRYLRDSFATSFERLRSDVHPPLYYLLLDGWTLLLGNSVFALRLLSALIALPALAATYTFGAKAFNKRVGLMALLLLGTSGFFVYYSRETRSYSLYMALATLASLALWRFWKKPVWQRGLSYGFFATALLYTHYTGATVILAHGLFLLIDSLLRPDIKRFVRLFFPFVFIGVIFGVWWFLFGIEQFRINTSIEAAGALPSDWNTLAALWLLLTSGLWGVFALIFALSRLNPLSWILQENRLKLAGNYKAIILILLLGIVPLLLLLAANAYGLAIFQIRYLIAIVPIWALIVAYALAELWNPFLKNQRILDVLSLILLLWICQNQLTTFSWFWPEKPRWEEASQLASDARESLEPALVYLDERSPFAYYAYQDGLLNGLSIRVSWREFAPSEIQDIAENLANAETAWAFVAMQAPESWDAVAALSEGRGVTYRDAVQWTIYYRFDKSSTEELRFNFGNLLAYQAPFYQQYSGQIGETVCVPVELEALADIPEDYSVGLHLTRGYNEVIAQADEGLGVMTRGQSFNREFCLTPPEAGEFHLRLVVYEWRNPLRRLSVFERDLLWGDYLMLGVLEVE